MSELSLSADRPLSGDIRLPGDKSLSHRAALFAAMAEGESVIGRFLVSGVTRAMLDALSALQVPWRMEGDRLIVTGGGLRGFRPPPVPIRCGNSATTLRLLAGALAAAGTPCVLDGSAGLRRRPMDRITRPLSAMGVPITAAHGGGAPLTLAARPEGTPLNAIDYAQPVASAQVKSCLILAALAGGGVSTLREPGPSRDHTERMLAAMGAPVTIGGEGAVTVAPLTTPLSPLNVTLPGDISSAAFLLVAAAILSGSDIRIRDVGVNPTRTGILDVLARMGAEITIENPREVAGEPVGDIRLVSSRVRLRAVKVGGDTVVRMIDEFPAFAIAACFARGVTEVCDATELRYKETDRISALCRELRKLGAEVEERNDGFAIQGGGLKGGTCDASGDHRLAMSLALAGLAAPDRVVVQNAEILAESFPDFEAQLKRLTT